jgi:hypothetical protein
VTGPATFDAPPVVGELADLFAGVWQVGYVANDLDAAMTLARDGLGFEHVVEVPTDTATVLDADGAVVPWTARIAMAGRGGLIAEIIEPVAGEVEFYRRFLPPDGGPGLRLHHLATQVPLGDEAWAAVGAVLAAAGLRFDLTVLIPDRVRAGYVDTTPLLGHWLEICQLQPADVAFFRSLVAAPT